MRTLEDLFNTAKTSVSEIYKKVVEQKNSDHQLLSVCIGETKNGEPFFCPMPAMSEDDVLEWYKKLRLNFSLQEVVAYVLIAEAVMTTAIVDVRDGSTKKEEQSEIVTIVGVAKGGQARTLVAKLSRDENGVPSIGNFEELPGTGGGISTRLLEDLPELPDEIRAVVAHMKQQARSNLDAGRPVGEGLSELNEESGLKIADATDILANLDPFAVHRAAAKSRGVYVDTPSRYKN